MDNSQEVHTRFGFNDYDEPQWTVTIGEGPDAPEGRADSLAQAAWNAQAAARRRDKKAP